MKILFVCTSNIMRSPYCDFVFNRMLSTDESLSAIVSKVDSAALRWRYHAVHPQARQALIREGFSVEKVDGYRPRHKWWDKELFREADVIIGMTESHRKMLPKRYRDKFCTLTEAAYGVHTEISDPYWEHLDQEQYNERMDEIKKILNDYAEKLKKEC